MSARWYIQGEYGLIAIDTNVLLRYLLQDDEDQAATANRLINGSEPVLLTDVVLVETVWTLTGKKYGLDKHGVLAVLNALFEEPNLRFENAQTVWKALNDYRKAEPLKVGRVRKSAGFADALIVNKAKYCIEQGHERFDGVYTFDTAALEIPGAKRPGGFSDEGF
ncbi:MAG: PIN domain-containing protein [Gammaproteobacteria bacterium]